MLSNNRNNSSVGGYMPPQQPADGGAEAAQDYYYYYEMPDGSIGYMTANEYNQMYSPTDQQDNEAGPQPAGYVEPTYGQGTAYALAPGQAITTTQMNNDNNNFRSDNNDINNNMYYTYDAMSASPEQPLPPQQQQQQRQQVTFAPPVVYYPQQEGESGMATAPQPMLPHASLNTGWYVPPVSFAEMRKVEGTQKWTTSLGSACCKEPCFCLGACVAPWCVVAAHRRRLLLKDYTQYRCCAGVCGRVDDCACCGATPRCSLFWEILFCLPCACHANRYMMMQRYGLRKTCWDSTVLGCGCFCAPLHCCGECSRCFPESVCDWLYVVTYSCMLTQQHRELDGHDKTAA